MKLDNNYPNNNNENAKYSNGNYFSFHDNYIFEFMY